MNLQHVEAAAPASTPSTKYTPPPRPPSPTCPEIAADAAVARLAEATAVLDRQVEARGAALEEEGGLAERLYKVGSAWRRGGGCRG